MTNHLVRRVHLTLMASALMFGMSTVASAEVTLNVSVPFAAVIANPCLGEPVALSGELHVLLSIQPTGNGLHISSHFNPQGVSGTGLVTGAKYQGTGVTRTSVFIDAPPPFDFTFVNNFRIIGQGQANNYDVHSNFHIAVNAANEITASVTNINITCH
jgi:hypothetical protein